MSSAPTIASTSAELRRVEMFVPFKVAYGTTSVAELTIVQIKDSAGNVGIGEGAPPSYLSTEQKLRATEIARNLALECHGKNTSDAFRILAAHRADIFEQDPISWVAVETALWDLHTRQQGKSLCQEFGGPKRTTVETDITLPLLDVQEVAGFWQLMSKHQFRIIKIKVSGDIEADVARIREILRVAPKDIQIFVDGNQGFDITRCLKLLRELEKINAPKPLFFEQPLHRDAWTDLAALSRQCPIPVCLDETVSTAADMQRCIDQKTAPMINLKIMKSGIEETIKIIRLASAHKIPMMIGGMVESEITMTASLHMMCAFPSIQFADLDTPFFLRDRLCKDSAWHRNSASLHLNDGKGLGLELS
jgi:L-alanine-DL-glutamate epimerase-like enolase superfamily enzyme